MKDYQSFQNNILTIIELIESATEKTRVTRAINDEPRMLYFEPEYNALRKAVCLLNILKDKLP